MKLASIAKILGLAIDAYGGIKKGIKKYVKKRRVRQIEKAIDNSDTDAIDDILRRIKEKRDARKDA